MVFEKESRETERVFEVVKENMEDQTVNRYMDRRSRVDANIYSIDVDSLITDNLEGGIGMKKYMDNLEVKVIKGLLSISSGLWT